MINPQEMRGTKGAASSWASPPMWVLLLLVQPAASATLLRRSSHRADRAPGPALIAEAAPAFPAFLAGAQVGGVPPPPLPPNPLDALRAAAAARSNLPVPVSTGDWRFDALHPSQQSSGAAPLVPADLAEKAAQLAYQHLFAGQTATLNVPAAAGAAGAAGAPAQESTTIWPMLTTPTTTSNPMMDAVAPRLGPPKPQACPEAPPVLTHDDVLKVSAPFKPPMAGFDSQPYRAKDNSTIWPLMDGGWAFQYPDMYAHVDKNGKLEVAWGEAEYAVAMEDDRVSYHSKNMAVHKDAYGTVVFHQPKGTIHQRGEETIYHWCEPNIIIYQTPSGVVYYDDQGMTFRGQSDLAHYAANGDVIYQGVGGITYQKHDGSVTHWTEAGALYRHLDGSLSYTPVGESKSLPMEASALPPDPFPGPPMTAEQVLWKVNQLFTTTFAPFSAEAATTTQPPPPPPPSVR